MLSNDIILLFGILAGVGISLHLLFRRLNLRKRLAPKMRWWLPAVLVILFVCVGMLIVRTAAALDPAEHHLYVTRAIEGAYLGIWLASVPVFSPNKRWDRS